MVKDGITKGPQSKLNLANAVQRAHARLAAEAEARKKAEAESRSPSSNGPRRSSACTRRFVSLPVLKPKSDHEAPADCITRLAEATEKEDIMGKIDRNSIEAARSLTGDLKAKSRRRRESLKRLAGSSSLARATRNDLLPQLDLVYVLLEDLRTPAREVRKLDPAHVLRSPIRSARSASARRSWLQGQPCPRRRRTGSGGAASRPWPCAVYQDRISERKGGARPAPRRQSPWGEGRVGPRRAED